MLAICTRHIYQVSVCKRRTRDLQSRKVAIRSVHSTRASRRTTIRDVDDETHGPWAGWLFVKTLTFDLFESSQSQLISQPDFFSLVPKCPTICSGIQRRD